MSNLTVNDVHGLMEAYQAVHNPDLRENLEQEQSEVEELGLEIIENAAYVLFSQGYDVDDVISYFTEATVDTITEDFVNYAEGRVLLESVVVSDEYIEEQFQQLDEIAGLLARGAGLVAKGLGMGQKAAKATQVAARARNIQNIRNARTAVPSGSARVTTSRAPGGPRIPGTGPKITTSGGKPANPNMLQKAGNWAKTQLGKLPGAQTAVKFAKSPAGKLIRGVGGKVIPGVGAALYGADAADRLKKGDWGGAALSGLGAATSFAGPVAALAPLAIQTATDAMGLTGDKSRKGPSTKTAPSAKFNASKALGGKTAFAAGGGAAAMKKDPALTAADVQKKGNEALFKAGGGSAAMTQKGQTRAQVIGQGVKNSPVGSKSTPATPSAPSAPAAAAGAAAPAAPSGGGGKPPAPPKPAGSEKPKPEGSKLTPMQQWAKANPKLADKVKLGQSGYEEISAMRTKPGPNEKQDQTPTTGPKTTPVDPKPTPAAGGPKTRAQVLGQSYEYDAYDLVLEYLFSEGHVDTLDEALYVMMEMDSKTIQTICAQN